MDDAVGDPFDQLVMSHDHARRALGANEVAQHAEDRFGGGGVELAGGFVGKQERRSSREGDRERDALLLPAGKLVTERVATTRQPDAVQELVDPALAFRRRNAAQSERQGDRVGDP